MIQNAPKNSARSGLEPQYLTIARFTADLAERGVLVVGSESPFAQAWDMMTGIIGLGWDELEKSNAEAVATAHELRRVLAGMGFYTS